MVTYILAKADRTCEVRGRRQRHCAPPPIRPADQGADERHSTASPSHPRETMMKRFILTAALLGSFFALSGSEANAFVCARGVYRAGCAGPHGAVVGHRGYYGGAYRGG